MATPSGLTGLRVRQAAPEDLDAVVALLHGAFDWLIAQGISDQWVRPFPRNSIEESIERGEVYIAHSDDRVIATFTLSYRPDRELWGDPPDDAGYVGRLVVERNRAGHGIGGQLLDRAGQLVAATGRRWLRLDCAKHNVRLHDYYRAHGFTHLRTIDLAHRESGALFERLAGPEPASITREAVLG